MTRGRRCATWYQGPISAAPCMNCRWDVAGTCCRWRQSSTQQLPSPTCIGHGRRTCRAATLSSVQIHASCTAPSSTQAVERAILNRIVESGDSVSFFRSFMFCFQKQFNSNNFQIKEAYKFFLYVWAKIWIVCVSFMYFIIFHHRSDFLNMWCAIFHSSFFLPHNNIVVVA